MLKMIPHFAASDGALFTDLDKAAEHERKLVVQDLLLMNRVALGVHLDEIEKIARVTCELKDDLNKALTADLKRGFHHGGIVPASRPAVPAAKRTKDANSATVFIDDTVHPVSNLAPDAREKWGKDENQTVTDIHEDGTVTLSGSPNYRWNPSSFRRGPAVKSAV